MLIERKKRQFASQDVSELIRREGLDPKRFKSGFPLESFDNTDFETRDPALWAPEAEGQPPAPARMLLEKRDGSIGASCLAPHPQEGIQLPLSCGAEFRACAAWQCGSMWT